MSPGSPKTDESELGWRQFGVVTDTCLVPESVSNCIFL